MFVTTKYLHGEEDGGRLVTPDQLVEMQSRGVTIGAHSHSHRGLTTLAETERRDEISSCKRLLEALLGKEVKWFAYPGGAFNRQVAEEVRDAGFLGAVSTLGPARNTRDSLYWLFREVPPTDTPTLRDRILRSRLGRKALELRTRQLLGRALDSPFPSGVREKDILGRYE